MTLCCIFYTRRPQSFKLFLMITSVTASNTNWILEVSVAHVKWVYISFWSFLLFKFSNFILTYDEASSNVFEPVYSGKQIVRGLRAIFSLNKSFLFKNKIMEVVTNHLLLQIESKSFIDSTIRFISSSSASTKS